MWKYSGFAADNKGNMIDNKKQFLRCHQRFVISFHLLVVEKLFSTSINNGIV